MSGNATYQDLPRWRAGSERVTFELIYALTMLGHKNTVQPSPL
jgi:hypothetical protein